MVPWRAEPAVFAAMTGGGGRDKSDVSIDPLEGHPIDSAAWVAYVSGGHHAL